MKISFQKTTLLLISSWLLLGLVVTALAFAGLLHDAASILLLIPILFLILCLWDGYQRLPQLSRIEKLLIQFLIGIWLIHSFGILVPETGFDAVWYHLPIAHEISEAHQLVYLPDLYQSLNPLFTDLLFVLGYQIGGVLGAKIVAYLIGVTLIAVTYALSRLWLSRYWSLWVAILVSTFQVVAWQSSSFYVDIGKAVWEIGALWVLLAARKNTLSLRPEISWLVAGGLVGASIATKAFSILLLPVFLILVWLWFKESKIKAFLIFMLGLLVIAVPFYLRTWWYSGNLFLSPTLHVAKLDEIGGNSDVTAYLIHRFKEMPVSLFHLTWGISDYVSIIFLVFMPLLLWMIWQNRRNKDIIGLLLFSLSQWVIWWLVPPLSTRYALSGFIVLTILSLIASKKWIDQNCSYKTPIFLVLVIAVSINLAPRLLVLKRNLQHVIGSQTQSEYLQQFKDGNIDSHLEKWYGTTSF